MIWNGIQEIASYTIHLQVTLQAYSTNERGGGLLLPYTNNNSCSTPEDPRSWPLIIPGAQLTAYHKPTNWQITFPHQQVIHSAPHKIYIYDHRSTATD